MRYVMKVDGKNVGEAEDILTIYEIEKYERTHGVMFLRVDIMLKEDVSYYVFKKAGAKD